MLGIVVYLRGWGEERCQISWFGGLLNEKYSRGNLILS